jgi:L-threonate 2-dehydrogenase
MPEPIKNVAVIGLGIMGGAIARNLIAAGFEVSGFDVDKKRASAAVATGVAVRGSAAEAVDGADLVLTSLPSVAALDETAASLAATPRPGLIVAEISTFPIAAKERARDRLADAGIVALDCPLSGTGAQAKTRDLALYGSGDEAVFGRCRDAFAGFARVSHYLGAFGNGSRMKFVANHLVAINNVAAAEAMILAERAGLDPQMVVDMVGPGAGGSRMFQLRAPMMVERAYEPATMKVSTWKKDMAIIAEFADDVGCATPLFTLTQPVYSEAMAMGLGDQDTASVYEVLKKTIVKPSA